ncbi:HNH endonuclease [Streptomyces sp. NBC_00513]|uniref:HNH endonuclease n=1 Tax=Streptomyces sp. NBC_00513 TaxID=2975763 RepID=UPI00352CE97E
MSCVRRREGPRSANSPAQAPCGAHPFHHRGNIPEDVDHAKPLALGGTDADGTLQVLCRGCHKLKTSTEFGAAVASH